MRSIWKTGAKGMMAVTILGFLTLPAFADWNPDDPFKWIQRPDLSDMGMDVKATGPYVLADDFECTLTGPLTEIHVWGSWYHDFVPFWEWPEGVTFTLSIHADIPAEQNPDGYSKPGELLWIRTFQPGEFIARVWADQLMEGWFEPPDIYEFPGDTMCWQYNFTIPIEEAFVQMGTPNEPIVYWLDLQAIPEDPEAYFGWKSSIDHWNDDAVWGLGVEPYNGPWYEMVYPPQHQWAGQSVDLAFVLVGEELQEDLDYGDAPDPSYPTLLASDGARHVIQHAFYMGGSVDSDANGQPTGWCDGDDNDINDDEDGVFFTSPIYPGAPVSVDVLASAPGFLDAWIDFDGDGTWGGASEQIFASQPLITGVNPLIFTVPASTAAGLQTASRWRYSSSGGLPDHGLAPDGEVEDHLIVIDDIPQSTIGDRVWNDLNMDGIQDAGEPGHPNVQVTLYDAGSNPIASTTTAADGSYFFTTSPGTYMLGFMLPGGYQWTAQDVGANDAIDSDVDAAGFTTWIVLAPFVSDGSWDAGLYFHDPQVYKWEQLPDPTPMGIDVHCQDPFILADDFLCDRSGPLTEIRVWGSWRGDYYPFDQDPSQVGFLLSIHTDIPAEMNPDGWSMPGHVLWLHDMPPGTFSTEHFFEGPEGWMDPPDMYQFPGDFNCWLYTFRIDPSDAFWQYGTPEEPVIYWLDVQAYPMDPEATFGWKTSEDHWNDDAVWGMGNEPYPGPWWELRYPPGHELYPESIDLAFGLTGEEMPLSLDYGDAPDPSFPTLLAGNGARHVLVGGVFLGGSVDSEPDGQPTPVADGDDTDGNDDEDGVQFTSWVNPGGTSTVDVFASTAGILDAWIDFDGDGTWSGPGEQIFAGMPLAPGINSLSYNPPANGLAGHTSFARFRFSLSGAATFTGIAYGGEVEDYEVWIEDDTTDVPDALPKRFGMRQNMPNPFNPVTMIGYDAPAGGGHATLEIFDLAGRKVATLIDGHVTEGRHHATWRGIDDGGRALPSGVYFARFKAADCDVTKKMVLLR